MTVTDQVSTPALDQARALEGIVSTIRGQRDDANRDRSRLLFANIGLTAELAERDATIADLRRALGRHESAALAAAAAEAAAAAAARPVRRPLTAREHLLATVACLAVPAALCGLAVDAVALFLGGLAALGVSAAALAVCRTAPDPGHPFDLDPAAPKRTAVRRG